MGILLKDLTDDSITFYLKGADIVMAQKLKTVYQGFMNDECEMMANEGLRTLG